MDVYVQALSYEEGTFFQSYIQIVNPVDPDEPVNPGEPEEL